jgi:hypothetical protein
LSTSIINSNLSSLEGCPDGLKTLDSRACHSLQSLEPFRRCTELESLTIRYALQISGLTPLNQFTRFKKLKLFVSRVSDLSVLSSMPLLEEVDLDKGCLKGLSPLTQCKRLRVRNITCVRFPQFFIFDQI